MDKLRTFLKVVQIHWFWFSCLAICLFSSLFWFLGARSLKASFQERYADIEAAFSTGNTLRSAQNHPNDDTKVAMDQLIVELKTSVRTAWEKQYEEQGDDVFVWPDGLSDDFINEVKGLRPIEAKVGFPTPPNEQLAENFLYEYANFIKRELPSLAEIIGASWDAADVSAGGGEFGFEGPSFEGGDRSPTPTFDPFNPLARPIEYVVNWNAANQTEIQSERFDWNRGTQTLPSTLEMLYAQEDYWILTSIMQIVLETNSNVSNFDLAEGRKKVVLREIDYILLGKKAPAKVGSVYRPVAAAVAGEDGEFIDSSELLPDDELLGEDGSLLEGAIVDPAEGRYVDKNYNPLSAEELRSASESTDPELAYLSVAKRMPVRMKVRIDQRAIPKFLVACANAALTIEVRQVRVNPTTLGTTGGLDEGSGDFGSPTTTQPDFGDGTGGVVLNKHPWDVDVEIYGIVYVYNPVAEEKLKLQETDEGGDEPSVEGGDPVEPTT